MWDLLRPIYRRCNRKSQPKQKQSRMMRNYPRKYQNAPGPAHQIYTKNPSRGASNVQKPEHQFEVIPNGPNQQNQNITKANYQQGKGYKFDSHTERILRSNDSFYFQTKKGWVGNTQEFKEKLALADLNQLKHGLWNLWQAHYDLLQQSGQDQSKSQEIFFLRGEIDRLNANSLDDKKKFALQWDQMRESFENKQKELNHCLEEYQRKLNLQENHGDQILGILPQIDHQYKEWITRYQHYNIQYRNCRADHQFEHVLEAFEWLNTQFLVKSNDLNSLYECKNQQQVSLEEKINSEKFLQNKLDEQRENSENLKKQVQGQEDLITDIRKENAEKHKELQELDKKLKLLKNEQKSWFEQWLSGSEEKDKLQRQINDLIKDKRKLYDTIKKNQNQIEDLKHQLENETNQLNELKESNMSLESQISSLNCQLVNEKDSHKQMLSVIQDQHSQYRKSCNLDLINRQAHNQMLTSKLIQTSIKIQGSQDAHDKLKKAKSFADEEISFLVQEAATLQTALQTQIQSRTQLISDIRGTLTQTFTDKTPYTAQPVFEQVGEISFIGFRFDGVTQDGQRVDAYNGILFGKDQVKIGLFDSVFRLQGQGVKMQSNDIAYCGEFANDRYQGKGMYFYQDGSVQSGQLVQGKFEGEAMRIRKGGQVEIGQWHRDKLLAN